MQEHVRKRRLVTPYERGDWYERNIKFNFSHITYNFVNNYNDKIIAALSSKR